MEPANLDVLRDFWHYRACCSLGAETARQPVRYRNREEQATQRCLNSVTLMLVQLLQQSRGRVIQGRDLRW
jgi:hypothetical protein